MVKNLKAIVAVTVAALGGVAISWFVLDWAAGRVINFSIVAFAVAGVINAIADLLEWAFNPKGS